MMIHHSSFIIFSWLLALFLALLLLLLVLLLLSWLLGLFGFFRRPFAMWFRVRHWSPIVMRSRGFFDASLPSPIIPRSGFTTSVLSFTPGSVIVCLSLS